MPRKLNSLIFWEMKMSKTGDSVIDALFSSASTEVEDGTDKSEMSIPKKCSGCMNALICNVLPVVVGFSRMGIELDIKTCPYFNQVKNG